MPFARPSPSRVISLNLLEDPINSSICISDTLATPWDTQAHGRQLEVMRIEASSSSSSSSAASSCSLDLSGNSPSIQTMSVVVPAKASQIASVGSYSSTTPSVGPSFTKTGKAPLSMKQRLFQISDTESDNDDENEDAENIKSRAPTHLRSARNDPIRNSISALSGVTVIGKGHSRDREGSSGTISSGGSSRSHGSFDKSGNSGSGAALEGDPSVLSLERKTSYTPSHVSQSPAPDSHIMISQRSDVGAPKSLSTLEQYPRSSHSPARSNQARSISLSSRGTPPLPSFTADTTDKSSIIPSASARGSGLTANAQASTSSQSIEIPLHSGASPISSRSWPRKHSRTSTREREEAGLLSPVLKSGHASPLFSSIEGSFIFPPSPNLPISSNFNGQKFNKARRPPSFSTFSFDNIVPLSESKRQQADVAPPYHTIRSRRSSKASEHEQEQARPSRQLSPSSRSVSTSDLSHIMRSFSPKNRHSPTRQDTNEFSPIAASVAPIEGTSRNPLGRSTRSNASNADLKAIIQQKRRQASGSFYTSNSFPNQQSLSGTTSPLLQSRPQSPTIQERPTWEGVPRRVRSRRNTAAGMANLVMSANTGENGLTSRFEEARLRAMRGMGEVVMTPSIEVHCFVWKSLTNL